MLLPQACMEIAFNSVRRILMHEAFMPCLRDILNRHGRADVKTNEYNLRVGFALF